MKGTIIAALLVAFSCLAAAQPFAPGQGVGPLGTWRTSDRGGPYNISLLSQQANEVAAGGYARQNFTDKDIVDFLVNVECLEGRFDTYGAFGRDFLSDLALGGPTPIGAQKANLSSTYLPYMEEVALNEQGHALFTRQAGGMNPCPLVDITGGFNAFFAAAYGLNSTVQQTYGTAFNPFLNDATFFLSVLTLEELGATGNKGLAGIISNPVIANGVAGLATSATAQATIERIVLWQLRDQIIPPFNENVVQVFSRISALRDALDGSQIDDQGLTNTDPRFIAVPNSFVNFIPTDIRGLTLNRTPQQIINILTIGNGTVGGFFPNGLLGAINSSVGYNITGNGLADFPSGLVGQEAASLVGTVAPPITGPTPDSVPGQLGLTQGLTNQRANSSYLTRGYVPTPDVPYNNAPTPSIGLVQLPIIGGSTAPASSAVSG